MIVMKAVILAAGKGTRMLPLTKDKPKHLIEILGKPFLYYLLKEVSKSFKEIAIIVSYKKEMIEKFLERYKFNAGLIPQDQPLGTGHAVMQARGFADDEEFVVLMGDNLYSSKDLEMIKSLPGNQIGAFRVKDPENYGVLVTDNSRLIEIVEKSPNPPSNLINTGLYKFTPEIFDALDKIEKSERGEYEITSAISILAKQKKVKIFPLKLWIDFGKIEDIKKIERFLNENISRL